MQVIIYIELIVFKKQIKKGYKNPKKSGTPTPT